MGSIWPISSSALPSRPSGLLVFNRSTLTGCLMEVALRQKAGFIESKCCSFSEDLSPDHRRRPPRPSFTAGGWSELPTQRPGNLPVCHLSRTLSVSERAVGNDPPKGFWGKRGSEEPSYGERNASLPGAVGSRSDSAFSEEETHLNKHAFPVSISLEHRYILVPAGLDSEEKKG